MFVTYKEWDQGGGGAGVVRLPAVVGRDRIADLADRTRGIDWIPDLGQRIGSPVWWRGLASCTALCAGVIWAGWTVMPPLRPVTGYAPRALAGAEWEEARAQSIAPIAFGATSGRRMAAGALVRPLATTPERPSIDLTATAGTDDTLARVLGRAGVGGAEAGRVAALVRDAADPDALRPGTVLRLTLGRRASRSLPRPLDRLAYRAAFDLDLTVNRGADGTLSLDRRPIAVDRTPLHVSGTVGAGLFRSARAAGVPARLVEAYLKAVGPRVSLGSLRASDTFHIVADRARAVGGEEEIGDLQLATLTHARRTVRLVRWGEEGGAFLDANGTPERRGAMGMPVAGRVTSTFGYRMHPLLGFMRMHKGMDIGAHYGSPIYAAADGLVTFSGRSGGYGNFVKLAHAGGYASGYGHMSRIAVPAGTRVRRGEVIGFVGSTGMSTGPHLHWEVWRGGAAVNPRTLSLAPLETLPRETLRAVRAKAERLMATPVG